ncbi:MAG: PAS domain S-box protein [Pseudomonadota bacterium]
MTDDLILKTDHLWTVSEARFAAVLDTAVDGIIVINDTCRILAYNRACQHLFGYTYNEVIGKNVHMLMPENIAAQHDGFIERYLETGEKRIIGIGRELEAQHKNGTLIPIELSVGESSTPAGRQFIGIIRDVRARKASEERLNQLQAQVVHMARVSAINEMGAAIAHELNQPLTAVLLYLQAITRRLPADKDLVIDRKMAEILIKATRETERAGAIIQKMRKFVEKRDPERRLTDLKNLIDEAIELTLVGSRRHNVSIQRQDQEDLPPIFVDAVQIQQILVNLVRNALEAARHSDDPWIRISTSFTPDDVFVAVTDSGSGIPKDALKTLFKAFASNKIQGLGLGLAISRAIAQNHAGDLTAEPGGDGQGATFTLKIPQATEPVAAE